MEKLEKDITNKWPFLEIKRFEHLTSLQEVHDNIHLCRFCNRKFGDDSKKRKHEKVCTHNPMIDESILLDRFCCDKCGSSYKHKFRLNTHINFDCGKSHKCEKFEKDITKKMPLLKVKRIEYLTPLKKLDDNVNINLCRYCNKNIGKKNNQTRHENNCSHNRKIKNKILGSRFLCNNCGSNFKHKYSLRNHEFYDCGISHKCKICQSVYVTLRALNKHVRKCRKSQRKVKEKISKQMPVLTVKSIEYLNSLQEVNENIDIYSCRFCNRNFELGRRRKQHEKTCTRNPMIDESILSDRFCCKNCGSSFKLKSSLYTHSASNCGNTSKFKKDERVIIRKMPILKRNANSNFYFCRFCEQKYANEFQKIRHEKICTRNGRINKSILSNRFCCKNCGSSFKHIGSLHRHIKNNCVKIHKCEKCNKIYGDLSSLNRHIEGDHEKSFELGYLFE
ncbi:zinc finger protein 283-like isoform X2 [Leptopilina heterotoma]|uniref:zinc finger protein 283-like isoform X2 n=1 Tax=Leptopilina heterotoma TaxID=63436 RepID=UPI001CAA2BE4|nr:zinc finger protein 283-like isoform X2 [Leptopilina heterotoma]XP_043465628.1 zinc finger protein 283-like isoform X2 [Leptopilina heterotoma]XP_043465630.1 zinc finger protein 283-like isoform X2 [Leptopilina heterotoma]XP_043465631.1 zinc finger protein 283-like isoform X2 [Leptopilina heterotoma]